MVTEQTLQTIFKIQCDLKLVSQNCDAVNDKIRQSKFMNQWREDSWYNKNTAKTLQAIPSSLLKMASTEKPTPKNQDFSAIPGGSWSLAMRGRWFSKWFLLFVFYISDTVESSIYETPFLDLTFCFIHCLLRNSVSQFLTKWFLICETLLYFLLGTKVKSLRS